MTKPKTSKGAVVASKSHSLEIQSMDGKTENRLITDLLAEGIVANASMVVAFSGYQHDDLSLTDMLATLKEQGQAVNRGDLSAGERMLNAQAVTLNSIFAELVRRAALNMGEHLGATESYMRLALKAQSQSRATLETLATIKSPPVFARQANINNGGQQQVNMGTAPGRAIQPHRAGGERHPPSGVLCPPDGEDARTVDDTAAPRQQHASMSARCWQEGNR